MFKKFLPQETSFFDYFESHSRLIQEAADAFRLLTSPGKTPAEVATMLKDVEHRADHITHQCIEALHRTFITPIDRNDIHHLIKRMDDIVDSIDAAAARINLYEVDSIRPEVADFSNILCRAAVEIHAAVHELRNLNNTIKIKTHCIQLHHLENEGDVVHRMALARLFKEDSERAVYIIKWKEILEHLERATDECEDVANIIEGAVIEAS